MLIYQESDEKIDITSLVSHKDCKRKEKAGMALSSGNKIPIPAPLKITDMLYLVCLINRENEA